MRLLAVDDDSSILEYLSEILSERNHTVTTAASGNQALTALDLQTFDMIFMDIKMPEINGMDVIRELNRRGIGTPVIVLTGIDDKEFVKEALRLGAFDYLEKPFKESVFFATVDRAYRVSQATQRLRDLIFTLDDHGLDNIEKKYILQKILISIQSFTESEL